MLCFGEVPGSCDMRSWLGFKGAYGTAPCAEDVRDVVCDPPEELADPGLSGGRGDGMFHRCRAAMRTVELRLRPEDYGGLGWLEMEAIFLFRREPHQRAAPLAGAALLRATVPVSLRFGGPF